MPPTPPIQFDRVWKRYRIGSKHDSLRDAIPALLKRWAGRNGRDTLHEGEFWALQDVSFAVRPGETVGIIGPNGAGKSTILKLLSRICKQTTGQIRVAGRLAALIEVGAGFHPDLTGRENIYLNGTIMGLRRKELDRLFTSIVAFAGLEEFLEMPVKRYSSGMTVRLGFAIAAHVDPEILLVDEVLAVGDLAFQRKCYQSILDLKAKGTTIVFISHDLEAVQRLCDRVLLVSRGQIVQEGSPADVMLAYRQEVLRKQEQPMSPLVGPTNGSSCAVEVHTVQLLNADGRPCDTFETGQRMSIRFQYRATRPLQHPSVTIALERVDGLICHEASTLASNLHWDAWEGEGMMVLDYPTLNLLPNTYQVDVAVQEGQNPVPLVRVRRAAYFHISAAQQSRGAVYLDHRWSLRPARVSP